MNIVIGEQEKSVCLPFVGGDDWSLVLVVLHVSMSERRKLNFEVKVSLLLR